MINESTPISLKVVLVIVAAAVSWGIVYSNVVDTRQQMEKMEVKVDVMAGQVAGIEATLKALTSKNLTFSSLESSQ